VSHELAVEPADPQADRATLQTLAHQCQTYSPLVGLEESETPRTLFLDITGCEIHFGGEAALAQKLSEALRQSGCEARIAIADTIGAAWALSHYKSSAQCPCTVIPSGQHLQAIRPLSIHGLRLEPALIQTLLKLDVKTIGQVEKLPRTTLPSRFGKQILQRLDQAAGTAHELINPERLHDPLSTVWNFEEALYNRQMLEMAVRELLHRLLHQLLPHQAGVRELQCHLRGSVDRLTFTVRLLQSTLDAKHLWDLLQLEWDRQETAIQRSKQPTPRCLTDGVTSLCLEVPETAPLKVRQQTLFDPDPGRTEALAFRQFVERLTSRLGDRSVLRSQPAPDYQPEHACQYHPWVESPTGKPAAETGAWASSLARTRPLRLLKKPTEIKATSTFPPGPPNRIWRGSQEEKVVHTWGPERIATGWWREEDIQRDYYHIETDRGQHLWVFYCQDKSCWFLHGLYE
jgi:protein ImuB